MSCMSCKFFDDLHDLRIEYGYEVFWTIAPMMETLLGSAMALWLPLVIISHWRDSGSEGLEKLIRSLVFKLILLSIIITMMTYPHPSGGGNTPLIYYFFINPLEKLALGYGQIVISLGADVIGDAGGSYSALAGMVERQVGIVIDLGAGIISTSGMFSFPERLVAALFILLPFLFVWGIFMAFLVEALFKFVMAGVTAPLLLPALMWNPTRPFAIAMGRVLFGAFLTIIFASGAMGLTMKVVDGHIDYFGPRINAEAHVRAAVEDRRRQCQDMSGDSPACTAAREREQAAKRVANQVNSGSVLFSREFLFMTVIGLVSVLLHLGAKSLASNISGANDGAGPAAATVMAGKMMLGAGAATAAGAMFGRGGATSSLGAAMGSLPGGTSLRDHGALGGPMAAAGSLFSANGGGGGGGGTLAGSGVGGGGGHGGGGGGAFDGTQRYAGGSMGGGGLSGGGAQDPVLKSLQNIEKLMRGQRQR